MKENHKRAISTALKGHKVSERTKRKIGIANRGKWIKFDCDNCKKENEQPEYIFRKHKTHFCNCKCYKEYCKEIPFYHQNAYKGIRQPNDPKWIYSTRYRRSHPERISHLKAERYARQRNAEGSHIFTEWQDLKRARKYRCVICGKQRKLTKDHIIPLSEGGTDYITNIQPLCRNCNSQKWKRRTMLF